LRDCFSFKAYTGVGNQSLPIHHQINSYKKTSSDIPVIKTGPVLLVDEETPKDSLGKD
jgi:hypothetical protein